jgi:hypothetical protein
MERSTEVKFKTLHTCADDIRREAVQPSPAGTLEDAWLSVHTGLRGPLTSMIGKLASLMSGIPQLDAEYTSNGKTE